MTRRWLNLVLLLLVLLLATVVYFEPGKQSQQQVPLLLINPATLKQLEFIRPETQNVQLQQRDGQWYLQSPVEVAADPFMVKQVLSFLSQLSLKRYSVVDLELAKYGFQPARAGLVVDGVELSFGRVNPLNSHLYVKVADVMHMVLQNEISILRKDWYEYVSMRLLPNDVLVKLELPGLGKLVHELQGWRYEGDKAPASVEQLQALVYAWGEARALRLQPLTYQVAEKVIVLTFSSGQTMHLSVLQVGDELLLQRADLGLEYVFDESQAKRLLQWSSLAGE